MRLLNTLQRGVVARSRSRECLPAFIPVLVLLALGCAGCTRSPEPNDGQTGNENGSGRQQSSSEPNEVVASAGDRQDKLQERDPKAAANPDAVLLRWQFQPGTKFRWSVYQSIKMAGPQGDRTVAGTMDMHLDFNVHVDAVEDDFATLSISTARLRASSDLPDMRFKYDSQSAKQGEGSEESPETDKSEEHPAENDFDGSLMETLFQPLLNLEFAVLLDRSGWVASIDVDDETQQHLEQSLFQSTQVLFEREGFNSMFFGGFISLPQQPLAPGDGWMSKLLSSKTSPYGKMHFEQTVRYDGSETVDGRRLEKFTIAPTMKFVPDEKNPLSGAVAAEFRPQSADGVMYFDNQAGRLQRSEWSVVGELAISSAGDNNELKGEFGMSTRSTITPLDDTPQEPVQEQ